MRIAATSHTWYRGRVSRRTASQSNEQGVELRTCELRGKEPNLSSDAIIEGVSRFTEILAERRPWRTTSYGDPTEISPRETRRQTKTWSMWEMSHLPDSYEGIACMNRALA